MSEQGKEPMASIPEATLREVREFIRLVKDKCDFVIGYLNEPYLDDLADALLAKLEGK